MVDVETIIRYLRKKGASCRKVIRKKKKYYVSDEYKHVYQEYDCTFMNVRIYIDPILKRIKVGPTTEVDFAPDFKAYATSDSDEVYWEDAEKILTEDTDFEVHIQTERGLEEQFWFIFDLDKYKDAFEFARKLAEEDIWVRIKYHGEAIFKKGDDYTFNNVYEFADYIKKLRESIKKY